MSRRHETARNKAGELLSALDLGADGATVRNHELGRDVARTATFELAQAKLAELAAENPTRTERDYE